MTRLYTPSDEQLINDAVATIAAGSKQGCDIKGFMHNIVAVAGSGTASFTIKFKVSTQDDIDFTAAASPTNRWAYAECVSLGDRTAIKKGVDGVVIAANGVGLYEVNINGCTKLAAEVSSWTSGVANVWIRNYNNK